MTILITINMILMIVMIIIINIINLRSHGIGAILDYAAEAKDDALPRAEKAPDEAGTVGAPLSARKYVYESEALCDANARIIMDAIRAVKDVEPDGFAAMKMSALGDPALLERMSSCLVELRNLFQTVAHRGEESKVPRRPYYCMDMPSGLDWETFREGWAKLFVVQDEDELRQKFKELDADGDGLISYWEWTESMRLSEINTLVKGSCREEGPVYRSALDEEEVRLYRNLCDRVKKIMGLAQELGVRVMVDAEWTDIQPAIDHMVIFLQRLYNRGDRPIVFQTYQTYLKDYCYYYCYYYCYCYYYYYYYYCCCYYYCYCYCCYYCYYYCYYYYYY